MKFRQKAWLRASMTTLLCIGSLGLSAQNITKNFKNEPLRNVLKVVEKQTGMSVIYKYCCPIKTGKALFPICNLL